MNPLIVHSDTSGKAKMLPKFLRLILDSVLASVENGNKQFAEGYQPTVTLGGTLAPSAHY